MNISAVNNQFSASSQQDASLKTQIANLIKQIVKLSTKLQEIYRSDLPQKEKEAQSKPIQTQIEALSNRLVQLIAEMAKQNSKASESSNSGLQNPQISTSSGNTTLKEDLRNSSYLPSGIFATTSSEVSTQTVNTIA